MKTLAPLSLVAAIVAGCGQLDINIDQSMLVAGPDGWEEAADVVRVKFGLAAVPRTYWYLADDSCGGDTYDYQSQCYGGLQGANGILLAVPNGCTRPSCTLLVHELAHVKWDDHDHTRVDVWGTDPSIYGILVPGSIVGNTGLGLRSIGL